MAMGGSGLDTSQKGWVDATIDQMRGGGGAMGPGAGLANGLNSVPGLGSQNAASWVDQQINGMKGGAGASPAAAGIDISSQGASNWVAQATGSAGAGGGLGSLGGGPQLGALGNNFGGDPLQAQAEAARNQQLQQMLGTAGLTPGGGLGAASPLGGLV